MIEYLDIRNGPDISLFSVLFHLSKNSLDYEAFPFQIKNILVPTVADRHGSWHNCKLDIKLCSSAQLQIMQG